MVILGLIVAYLTLWTLASLNQSTEKADTILTLSHFILLWGIYWLMLEYIHQIFGLTKVYKIIRKRSLIPFFLFIASIQFYITMDQEWIHLLLPSCLVAAYLYMLPLYFYKIIKEKKYTENRFAFYYLVFFSACALSFFSLSYYLEIPLQLLSIINGLVFMLFCFYHLAILIKEDVQKIKGKDSMDPSLLANPPQETAIAQTNPYNLTHTESIVLQSILEGIENEIICRAYQIPTEKLTFHIQTILEKCNVNNRLELFALFKPER